MEIAAQDMTLEYEALPEVGLLDFLLQANAERVNLILTDGSLMVLEGLNGRVADRICHNVSRRRRGRSRIYYQTSVSTWDAQGDLLDTVWLHTKGKREFEDYLKLEMDAQRRKTLS